MLLISYGKPNIYGRNLNEISILDVMFYSLSRNIQLKITCLLHLLMKHISFLEINHQTPGPISISELTAFSFNLG